MRTVHNVTPPSGPRLDRALIRALDRRTDVRIRIAAQTPEADGVPSVLIPHGHYRTWFERMPRAAVVPGQFGYVGLIKPYKGVERLVDAYAAASAIDPTLTLRISGKPVDEGIERRLRAATARLDGLETTLRYVGEAEFVDVVTSSELVVLPYRFMHNSGTALAALSLGRPILVPANDVNRALSSEVGPGWVHLFDGDLTAGALLDAMRALRADPPAAAPDLSARGWDDAGALPRRRLPARPSDRRSEPIDRPRPAPHRPQPPTRTTPRDLVVVIPTFHRPERLANALTAVRQQVDAENGLPDAPMRCSILVVDNDPARLGRAVAREHGVTVRRRATTGDRRGAQSGARGVRERRRRRPALPRRRRDPRAGLASRHDRDVHVDQADRGRRSGGDADARRRRAVDLAGRRVRAPDADPRPADDRGRDEQPPPRPRRGTPPRAVVRRAVRAHRRQRQHVHAAAHATRRHDPLGGGCRRDRAGGSGAPHAVVDPDAGLPVRQHVRARADRARADGGRATRRTGAGVRPRSRARPGRKPALGRRGGLGFAAPSGARTPNRQPRPRHDGRLGRVRARRVRAATAIVHDAAPARSRTAQPDALPAASA